MEKLKVIYVEKKLGYDIEAKALLQDFRDNLRITSLEEVRVINRYVTEYMDEELFNKAAAIVFSESTVDRAFFSLKELEKEYVLFAAEYLPGQYDQRADAAMQCLAVLKEGVAPKVSCAVILGLRGDITKEELEKIKNYYINPVEKREASLRRISLEENYGDPKDIPVYEGFINMNKAELSNLHKNLGLAMSIEDLSLCQDYFIKEDRNPTETEIKVLDTYWSDHCRHTTFQTSITKVDIEEGVLSSPLKEAYMDYLKVRKELAREEKPINLMDLATIAMKELKNRGFLEDLDESDEINACTIKAKVETTEGTMDYLILFKNETHNHPTEIEPFGGAATCLGGAIRDPLSGRAYVYQAMRITGSGDPRERVEDTLKGKLPQRKITLGAAAGYSSYGNQIGLATGQVVELYDPGFKAKRMEIGAVIGAVPEKQVKRERPKRGDLIILLGGRTGRDGCGGATGSSKEHNLDSINECGAEVQKGNAPVERKLQRFFRRPEAALMIKKCNDFGAGGVSVAIGELSDSLDIYLDRIPKKYEGLNGTELAISESQERMAVVISPDNEKSFISMALEENLEATTVAEVTDSGRLRMWWREKLIVDIERSFLDTNGAEAFAEVLVKSPEDKDNYFNKEMTKAAGSTFEEVMINQLKDLNTCSQKGLCERFDSTIGANTVLMPFGGAEEKTPPEGMASRIPVHKGYSNTVSLMTYGYNPRIAHWSPYHGAHFAVIEAVCRIAAMGGDYKNIKLTFQEYFEKLGKDKEKWGKPFAALLGGYEAQRKLAIGAIGGKDSMSGTFENLTVPPTLVAFAVALDHIDNVLSPELKKGEGQEVYIVKTPITPEYTVDFENLKVTLNKLKEAVDRGAIASAYALREGGIAAGVAKMSFGNNIGISLNKDLSLEDIIAPCYGSFLIQLTKDSIPEEVLGDLDYSLVGELTKEATISYKEESLTLKKLREAWEEPLEEVFPTKATVEEIELPEEGRKISFIPQNKKSYIGTKISRPRVFIPVFPGTNCEYDSARAFEREGALVNTLVLKNLTPEGLRASIKEMEKEIKNSQILMLPGGFSAADEPEGSGKYIASVFRNKYLAEAVEELLYKRDGLVLGICNGFQALIKLGLLPYGRIVEIDENMPTLTYNNIGRHVSTLVETKVVSKLSPWFEEINLGEIHKIPVSHGEGRFTASPSVLQELIKKGQVATQYVNTEGKPTMEEPCNPNGSLYAIEGITSPDGRVLGKMAHSERGDRRLYKNIKGNLEQKIFSSGVNYFK
ncbi:phosphoribosylformylglycinamidine synthase [Alloiococcus sp. CFN-8]|uniref:phosphoribosylformylglycinamidine synthase n=1 Tax=Alloiococcus sp. CFN-8 TaxID=3416081 RepID=UPI003CF16354